MKYATDDTSAIVYNELKSHTCCRMHNLSNNLVDIFQMKIHHVMWKDRHPGQAWIDAIYPWIETIYPWIDTVYHWIETIYPWIDTVYPWIETIYPWIDTVYPWIETIYPWIDTEYHVNRYSVYIVLLQLR